MEVYLPIAEMSVNVFVILALGLGVGFMSGLLGLSSGFLMSPLLIFIGIPPTIAVGSQTGLVVATSTVNWVHQQRRHNVDFRLGFVMVAGAVLGTICGTQFIRIMDHLGHGDLTVRISYILFLGGIGIFMALDSVKALFKIGAPETLQKTHRHGFFQRLPLRMRFPRSRLYISIVQPIGLGFLGGIITGMMGIGGSFILIPALIYLVGLPVGLATGTAMLQITVTTIVGLFLQAVTNHSVDLVLSFLLIVSGVLGAQLGTLLSFKLRGETLRTIITILILSTTGKLVFDLFATPASPYSILSLKQL